MNQYINNLNIFGEHKLKPRATMRTYGTVKDLIQGQPTEPMTLNGSWTFKLSMGQNNRPQDFYKEDFDPSGWDTIEVPGVWQLQGYHEIDPPIYLAFSYPPAVKTKGIPNIDHHQNSVGSYIKTFHLDEDQIGQQIRLHFGAVKSAFYVWLNGTYVGYSQGSMTPAEFDLTGLARKGVNKLAVEVYRYSDGTYLEDQDMWFLSGIYRDVTIEMEPSTYIEDIYATCVLSDAYQNAKLKTHIMVAHKDDQKQPLKVDVSLYNPSTKELVLQTQGKTSLEGCMEKSLSLEAEVLKPLLWSAEQPNLYEVVVVLRDHLDQILQIKSIQFGFCESKIEEGIYLFNGKPLIFRGVNRHEFDPDKGWVPSRELYEKDFAIMKSLNINAIRTSHYPNDPLFYQLCNEFGFYVMDETDLETHGIRKKGIPGKKASWLEPMIDRGVRMVVRDRNHPCVVIWSMGNEAGFGPNFIQMKKAMLACDDTRPYHYEGDLTLQVSDFFSTMYGEPAYMKKIGEGQDIRMTLGQKIENLFMAEHHAFDYETYKGKPAILCEYAHAMNNSLGNFKDYMDLFYAYPNLCGGFIWDFVDQTIRMQVDGEERWFYGGDFGEEVTNGQFCANGIIASNRTLHPSAYEVKRIYQPFRFAFDQDTGLLTITNDYLFSDTLGYGLVYQLLEDGDLIDEVQVQDFMMMPQASLTIPIPEWEANKDSTSRYHLNVEIRHLTAQWWCEEGYVCAFDQFTKEPSHLKVFKVEPFGGEVVKDKNRVSLLVSDTTYVFNLKSGYIDQIRCGTRDMLQSALTPMFFRVPIDNDFGITHVVPKLRPWLMHDYLKEIPKKGKVTSVQQHQDKSGYTLLFQIKFPHFKGLFEVEYKVDGQGELEVSYKGTPKKALDKFGSTLSLIDQFKEVRWYGRGPNENYCDRYHGSPVGIYHKNIDEMVHAYVRPQENGQRTDTHWINMESQAHEVMVEAIGQPIQFSVWPYSVDDLMTSDHIHEQSFYLTTTLNIDHKQKGVGGDYPGDLNLKEPYKLHKKVTYGYTYRLMIRSK